MSRYLFSDNSKNYNIPQLFLTYYAKINCIEDVIMTDIATDELKAFNKILQSHKLCVNCS